MTQHNNPSGRGKAKTAMAPYNFVPLPKKIYTVNEKDLPKHDRFVEDAHSGYIDLTIKTLTPLFIRGPVVQENGKWNDRDSRLRPEPFKAPDGRPMIPGSSLRGMIRSIVEILSFSKIQPVTDERPFFRTVGNDRLGRAYRTRMMPNGTKPSGGFIKKEGDRWVIVPAKEVLRADHFRLNKLTLGIPGRPNPNYYPNWKGQHQKCWFERDDRANFKIKFITLDQKPGLEEGILVLSGSAPRKKADFIFVENNESNSAIEIPQSQWDRFHSEDQITQWQQIAYPKNKPNPRSRKYDGHLRDGEPVFFLCDGEKKSDENPDGLLFFGRAQMFRFPYDLSPLDLIPEHIKNAGLDLTEAMFGKVPQGKIKGKNAIKGRLVFEDALAISGEPGWFEETIVPKILSSPKITCFPHYLDQENVANSYGLKTYLEDDKATIRGHKLYWHRWDNSAEIDSAQGLRMIKELNNHDSLLGELRKGEPDDKQHTVIRPVKPHVTFSGRVHFENLNDIELGALLAAIKLPGNCAHKLGMGKPLGMGSVKIEANLNCVSGSERYSSWESVGVSRNDDGKRYVDAFEKAMVKHAEHIEEEAKKKDQKSGSRDEKHPIFIDRQRGLNGIVRINALFQLLRWDGRPAASDTTYMELRDFRSRPVLPGPHLIPKQTVEAKMISQLYLKNFTVFPEAKMEFGRNLNLFIGENGTGKSHVLKLIYAILSDSYKNSKKKPIQPPTVVGLQASLEQRLINVFRPANIGDLCRKPADGSGSTFVDAKFDGPDMDIAFGISDQNEIKMNQLPEIWSAYPPVFFPTQELMSIYPNFVENYEKFYSEFDETYRDACELLGQKLLKQNVNDDEGEDEDNIQKLLLPLEDAMGGKARLDKSGRFYLENKHLGRIEMHMVAEGYRKLAMMAQLVANGTIANKGFFFWDEPENNLNPKQLKATAEAIVEISMMGMQVFVSTHSLFFMKEIDILLRSNKHQKLSARFFGFSETERFTITVDQGDSFDDIPKIVALDEDLVQSDRIMAME